MVQTTKSLNALVTFAHHSLAFDLMTPRDPNGRKQKNRAERKNRIKTMTTSSRRRRRRRTRIINKTFESCQCRTSSTWLFCVAQSKGHSDSASPTQPPNPPPFFFFFLGGGGGLCKCFVLDQCAVEFQVFVYFF